MNRICPTILAAVALSGCGGPNYTLSGRAGLAPGDTLRLCSPYENDSVLATTVIRRDSSFRIRGHVSEPTIAVSGRRSCSKRPTSGSSPRATYAASSSPERRSTMHSTP